MVPSSGWRAVVFAGIVLALFVAPVWGDVTTSVNGNLLPGRGVAIVFGTDDGSTISNIAATQTAGADVLSLSVSGRQVNVRLAPLWRYGHRLVQVMEEPPVGADQLPPNVEVNEEEFVNAILLEDRWEAVSLNPFTLEETGLVVIEAVVTTSAGTETVDVELHTVLPWHVTTGLRTVPIGVPAFAAGRPQDSYDWRLLTPPLSAATGQCIASCRLYEFTPDVPGNYTARVTDLETMQTVNVVFHAGTFEGVIEGQDANGRPVSDPLCLTCHNDVVAPNKFDDWAQTGHAEIFTNNINTNSHYSTACFLCHSVGYNTDAENSGFDDAPDFGDFLDAFPPPISQDNWTMVLDDFPQTARLANVQCENCHGPNNSNGHAPLGMAVEEPRVSLSANVCAQCHGEPLRHARYQQWQLSPHANYELAMEEGNSGSCARCHTANGFLAWLPVLLGEVPGDPTANVAVTWEPDEVHPQTCVTCHDPHDVGTQSGEPTNAIIRVQGDTPELIAGFKVTGAGRGAICMTCHNSRRGLRNDFNFAASTDKDRAPHGGVQTDMLMGENAFLVNVGVRGSHSFLADTCVTCHMEATPPPDILSYNQGGTNHTFRASSQICSECHPAQLDYENLRTSFDAVLEHVGELINEHYADFLNDMLGDGATVDFDGEVTATMMGDVEAVVFSDSHGRQAIAVTIDGTEYGPYSLSAVDVTNGGSTQALSELVPQDWLKAGWNFLMLESDGSHGAHNYRHAYTLLSASRNVFDPGGGGPRLELPVEITR